MHALLLAAVLARGAVDDAVRLVLRTSHAAGISVGAVKRGQVVYERGFGYANLGSRARATAATVYRIGSLSKAFTAQAIETLAARGAISLQDPVERYVHPFPWGGITIGELLAQRSGIPSYTDTSLDRTKAYAPAQLVDAVSDRPLLFAPGSNYAYSNTNYVLLGMIAERVSGMPFERFLQTAIAEPDGLHRTRYGDQPGEARGYARDTLNLPVPRSSTSYAFAAAGMTSNVPDLLTWLGTAREPYYGFMRASVYGYDAVYAIGNVNGYSACDLIIPSLGDRIAVLANADTMDMLPLVKSIVALLEPPRPGTYASGFSPAQNESAAVTRQLRSLLDALQRGTIERSALFPEYNAFLTSARLAALQKQLPKAPITSLEFAGREILPDGTNEAYRVNFSDGTRIAVTIRYAPGHKIAGITLQQP